ncbi:2-hydroxy-3-oxopropionate reductase [Caballeronia sp. LZ035]|uniref:2-hydroxy-3-oxopropionate reductase n=1 Tax=Caballeronia sp. LZ035 TaxID=3038568 RepID=UPI0028657261|nr:2-hydroxy-3-oxopropionate reductase [Caballeronia sp. LZ035]MDR5759080.1 2-hydroxy-3-oxopropionate reductase [Caballeronia sp. LZ035]
MAKLGFIGLGIMGRPMATNLIHGGHTLFLHTRSGVPGALTDLGGNACTSPADVARHADIIFLMLPDTPDVERVLFGEHGIIEGLTQGKIVVDMSSIAPVATHSFARRIEAAGCGYLDAPVSGGEVGAKAGSLTIMVGGAQEVFDVVEPFLTLMGRSITLVGECGAGQTTKVANQMIVALNIQAVAEALLFASKAGADPAKVREALMGGFAASRVLEIHGERMVKRSFDPGFRIALHCKDLQLAVNGARTLEVELPHTTSVHRLMNSCLALGLVNADHSALCQATEKANGYAISKPNLE